MRRISRINTWRCWRFVASNPGRPLVEVASSEEVFPKKKLEKSTFSGWNLFLEFYFFWGEAFLFKLTNSCSLHCSLQICWGFFLFASPRHLLGSCHACFLSSFLFGLFCSPKKG